MGKRPVGGLSGEQTAEVKDRTPAPPDRTGWDGSRFRRVVKRGTSKSNKEVIRS